MKCVVALFTLLISAAPVAAEEQFPLPPKAWPAPINDHRPLIFVLGDFLEYRVQQGADTRAWDAQAWVGGDYNRLWLKSEGEQGTSARTERGDVQALYARLISPFWYLQAGARTHFLPTPLRQSLALGIQGIAPYWFDVEGEVFLDQKGKVTARVAIEYDFLLTQRLILQPRGETNISAMSDPERGLGRGFNDIELGLRLRYELHRQFAPYVGGNWTRQLGSTADLARQAAAEVGELSFVAGLRVWL